MSLPLGFQIEGLSWPLHTESLSLAWLVVCFILLVAIVWLADTTDVSHIKNLPSIPGLPILGSLTHLGKEQPRRFAELAKQYGPVFQVRLGNKRFVVANSFKAIKELWIDNQSSLISRPTLHTFHNVLSTSQGFTIGTSPWDDSCKRRRKSAAAALNRPSVKGYMPFVDLESLVSIKELADQLPASGNAKALNCYALFQRLALNLSLTLGYGFRIDGKAEDGLLTEIVNVERGISTLRSTSNNWQDFVPLLRLLSRRSNEAEGLRARRDQYLTYLLDELKAKIATGKHVSCITGNILQDPDCKLTEAEIKSICVTMIAGGLDTTPACIWLGIAMLSARPDIQEKLREDIQQVYGEITAWEKCLHDERAPYVMAFCKEVLRFWTVVPMSLPRVSIKDVYWSGACIPAGTTFLMNAWAADYDEGQFKGPSEFDPDRFMNIPEGAGTQHFAFGAGSRMCTGSHLAYREMYITFIRMVLAFEMRPAPEPSDRPILTGPLECNANPTGLSIEPRDFKVAFQIRDKVQLEAWFEQSEAAVHHLR